MGFAIAEALADLGAEVNLIAGPTNQHTTHPGIHVKNVTTAREMLDSCAEVFDDTDIAVFSAAVVDYRPREIAVQKIKKKDADLTLELAKTDDIAAALGKRKRDGQVIVGFALETENEEVNALGKLKSKNFDLIVLNSLNDDGAGFGHDTNKVTILDGSKKKTFELKTKKQVAVDIVQAIIEKIHA